MDHTKPGVDKDVIEAARDYLARELSGDGPREKPRGSSPDRRPKLKGSPAADAVIEDRR